MDYIVLVDGDMVLHTPAGGPADLQHRAPARPLEKLLQETLAARTIRCDKGAMARLPGPVDGSVSVPVT
ncbi:hypothetical protein GCM10011487_60160 [Steroidobacter agaridevorans]|uniref:Uncharacterized protein n=1 Tax=Steroidobacter agaridevorans TaxID=2695856 RepID=A0A829YNF0_9GAMM|nr:hypothetical protein [Steroidobacter agaridevorans]GFE84016.1 hypothetical protein GCM10011487_60160 [Steroidobacter agaridevorans]GFE91467.1 hypothetical protein GCM10011488_64210 [Steroidobacter agaridevorans]